MKLEVKPRQEAWGTLVNGDYCTRDSLHCSAQILDLQGRVDQEVGSYPCWGAFSGYMFSTHFRFLIRNKYQSKWLQEIAKELFSGDIKALFSFWWEFLSSCGIKMEQQQSAYAHASYTIPEKMNYRKFLPLMTLMDIPQRFEGILYVVKKLSEKLPKVNQYKLLQIAHFLPYTYFNYGKRLATDSTRLGWVSNFHSDYNGHVCGSLNGEFPLDKTVQESLAKAGEYGSISNGFFLSGNNLFPCADWTWDQFAEYSEAKCANG